MDWKEQAIKDLRQYNYKKQSLESIPARIKALDEQATAIRSGLKESEPVTGGGTSRSEDRLINMIAEKERLKHTYRATARLVDLVEKGLNNLDERERLVLERFYMDRPKNHVDRLMGELDRDKSQIYRIKDEALYKFTITMYGLTEY